MKREDALSRMFEAEFCEPNDKADKERVDADFSATPFKAKIADAW